MDSDDKKISQLTRVTSLNDSDLFVVSIDVGTAPKTRAIKKSDVSTGGGDALPGSRGLVGANNTTTPNTKYDFSAEAVLLRDFSSSGGVVRTNTGTITCDITLPASGSTPTANGCDQSKISALTSQWVHFYFIWNGTTLATLASLTPPPTGPTLPSGYTHWAYINAVRLNSSSELVRTHIRGQWLYYDAGFGQNPLSGGTATTETAVDLSASVPPNAIVVQAYINIASTLTSSINYTLYNVMTGVNFTSTSIAPVAHAAQPTTYGAATILIPNIGQNVYYQNAGANGSANMYIEGYQASGG